MSFSSWLRYGTGAASTAARRWAVVLGAALVQFVGVGSAHADTFTASNAKGLINAINAANKAGGSHTVVLAAGGNFDLRNANNTTYGPTALPVVGGAKVVDLTILGNGATIQRSTKQGQPNNSFRLFAVAAGASLTLDRVTLRGGWASGSDAVALGGAVYNDGGTVVVSNSTLSGNGARFGGGVYTKGGALSLSGCVVTGNSAYHTDYPWSGAGEGGGLYSVGGTVTVKNASTITGNTVGGADSSDVGNGGVLYLDGSSTIGSFVGDPPIPI